MPNSRMHHWIGLAGVDADETPLAKRWARRLEVPTIVLALWILVLWYLETRHGPYPTHSYFLDIAIWAYFVFETSLLTALVRDRRRYLSHNWLNLVIIGAGLPVLWGYLPYATGLRSLRLLIFIGLLLQLSGSIRQVLARNHLGMTLLISALVVVIAGYLMAGIDPGIKNAADGIWWALVTVSSVGYGDIVPTTTEGRIFAAVLILAGMALFSLVTANLSVFFISQAGQSGELESPKEQKRSHQLRDIEKRLERIEEQLQRLLDERDSDKP